MPLSPLIKDKILKFGLPDSSFREREVTITPDNIVYGKPKCSTSCALSNALDDCTIEGVFAEVGLETIGFYETGTKDFLCCILMKPEALEIVRQFDEGLLEIKEHTVKMNLPEILYL